MLLIVVDLRPMRGDPEGRLRSPGDAKPDVACGRGIGAVRIVAATRIGVLLNVFVLDGVAPMQRISCLPAMP